MHHNKPYIGVMDFTSAKQVEQMLDVFNLNKTARTAHRMLHVGVMMSKNILFGRDPEYPWETPFLDPKKLSEVLYE